MSCCEGLSKIVLVILNALFLIASLVMLGLGIALVVNSDSIVSFTNDFGLDFHTVSTVTGDQLNNILKSAGYFMIILGAIVAIITIFGFCGACCENSCMLIIYVVFMVAIIAAQVALIVFVVVYPSTLTKEVGKVMKEALQKGFKKDMQVDPITGTITNATLSPQDIAWTILQTKVQCCGGEGIGDYGPTEFSWTNCGTRCSGSVAPISCCKLNNTDHLPRSEKDYVDFNKCMTSTGSAYRNEQGCGGKMLDLITNIFSRNRAYAIAIAVIIIVIEAILIIMACAIIREDK